MAPPFWDAEMLEVLVVSNKLTIGASHARLLVTAHNIIINNDSAYSFIEIKLK